MKKICAFFLALAVFLLPEMVYAANATPQAVNMPHVYIVFGVLFVAAVLFLRNGFPWPSPPFSFLVRFPRLAS